MKPDTRRESALFAARLHVQKGTLLSDAAVADIAAELLATHEEADLLAGENERLRLRLDVKSRPTTIEPGLKCIHGVPLAKRGGCSQCTWDAQKK